MSWMDIAIFTGVAAVGYFIVAGVLNLFKSKKADAEQSVDDFPPLEREPNGRGRPGTSGWEQERGRDPRGAAQPDWEVEPLAEEPQPAGRGGGAFSEFDRRCPNRNCNESNAPDSQFCRRCGTRL